MFERFPFIVPNGHGRIPTKSTNNCSFKSSGEKAEETLTWSIRWQCLVEGSPKDYHDSIATWMPNLIQRITLLFDVSLPQETEARILFLSSNFHNPNPIQLFILLPLYALFRL